MCGVVVGNRILLGDRVVLGSKVVLGNRIVCRYRVVLILVVRVGLNIAIDLAKIIISHSHHYLLIQLLSFHITISPQLHPIRHNTLSPIIFNPHQYPLTLCLTTHPNQRGLLLCL